MFNAPEIISYQPMRMLVGLGGICEGLAPHISDISQNTHERLYGEVNVLSEIRGVRSLVVSNVTMEIGAITIIL